MNAHRWQNAHVWEYALHVYANGEDGVKNVAKRLGLGWTGLALRVKREGLPRKIHASTRKRLSGCKKITALKRKWVALLNRVRAPYKKKKTSLDHYYANHAANKERSRLRAAANYIKAKGTGEWKVKQACRNAVSRVARMISSRRKPRTRTAAYLGCDYPTARAHIERKFKAGMNWGNHGDAWEIDHIKPLASFNLTDDVQLRIAMHYTNLQPLWFSENRAKGASLLWGTQ